VRLVGAFGHLCEQTATRSFVTITRVRAAAAAFERKLNTSSDRSIKRRALFFTTLQTLNNRVPGTRSVHSTTANQDTPKYFSEKQQ